MGVGEDVLGLLSGVIKHFFLLVSGPMFVPGASGPIDKTPLQSFVDQSVSDALIKHFEDKGDPGRLDVV